jgi:hypothetical protein
VGVVEKSSGKWFSSSISYLHCNNFSTTHYSLFHSSSQLRPSLKASLKTARKTLRVTKKKENEKRKKERKKRKRKKEEQTILVILTTHY